MNIVDAVLVVLLGYAAFRGFKNGLVKEILGIAGLFIAVVLGFNLISPASNFITEQWSLDGKFVPYIAFGGVFFFTLILIAILTVILDNIIKFVFLSIPNRIFGALFSTLKMGILLSLGLIFMSGFNFPKEETRTTSFIYNHVVYMAPNTYDALSVIVPGISNYKNTVDRTLDEYNPLKNLQIDL